MRFLRMRDTWPVETASSQYAGAQGMTGVATEPVWGFSPYKGNGAFCRGHPVSPSLSNQQVEGASWTERGPAFGPPGPSSAPRNEGPWEGNHNG